MNGINVAGDVIAGGTALAGLILVYIGSLVAAYAGFEPTEQNAVKSRFLTRARIALGGMCVALTSAILAVLSKWLHCFSFLADWAVFILLLSLLYGIFIGFKTVEEIK